MNQGKLKYLVNKYLILIYFQILKKLVIKLMIFQKNNFN